MGPQPSRALGRRGQADGLAGEKIPLGARIIAVAEAYVALTAGRGCERMPPLAALDRITERSGSGFDPAIGEALGRTLRDASLDLVTPELALPAIAQAVVDLAPEPHASRL